MDEKVLRKFKTNNLTTMKKIFHNCSECYSNNKRRKCK